MITEKSLIKYYQEIISKDRDCQEINTDNALKASWLDTPLGPMLVVANDSSLFLLEFVERRGLEREIERMRERTKSAIIPGKTKPIELIEKQLKKKEFQTVTDPFKEWFEGYVKTMHKKIWTK